MSAGKAKDRDKGKGDDKGNKGKEPKVLPEEEDSEEDKDVQAYLQALYDAKGYDPNAEPTDEEFQKNRAWNRKKTKWDTDKVKADACGLVPAAQAGEYKPDVLDTDTAAKKTVDKTLAVLKAGFECVQESMEFFQGEQDSAYKPSNMAINNVPLWADRLSREIDASLDAAIKNPQEYPRCLANKTFPFHYDCTATDIAARPDIVLPAKALIAGFQVLMRKGNRVVELNREQNQAAQQKAAAHVLIWWKTQFNVVLQNTFKFKTTLQTQLKTCDMQGFVIQVSHWAKEINSVFQWPVFDAILTQVHDIASAVDVIRHNEERCDSLLNNIVDVKKKLNPEVTAMYPPAAISGLAERHAGLYEKWWRNSKAMQQFGVEEGCVKKEDSEYDEADLDALGATNAVVDCDLDIIKGAADLGAVPPDIGSCACCKKKVLQHVRCGQCRALYHVKCAVAACKVQTLLQNQTWCCPKCDPSLMFTPLDTHEGAENLASDVVLGSAMAQQCVEESTAREKQLRNTLQLVNDESDKKSRMIMTLCNRLQELGEDPSNIQRQRAKLAEIKQEKVAAVSAGDNAGDNAGGGSSSAGDKRKRSVDDDEVIDVTPARAEVAAGGSAAGGSAQPAAGGSGSGGSGSGHTAVAIPKKKQKQQCLHCDKPATKVVEQSRQNIHLCQDCFDSDIIP